MNYYNPYKDEIKEKHLKLSEENWLEIPSFVPTFLAVNLNCIFRITNYIYLKIFFLLF